MFLYFSLSADSLILSARVIPSSKIITFIVVLSDKVGVSLAQFFFVCALGAKDHNAYLPIITVVSSMSVNKVTKFRIIETYDSK